MLLTETFSYQIGTIKTRNGNNMRVAYIDARRSQDTYSIRKEIQSYGAKWEPNGKWWYWPLGNDPEGVINTKVKPCIEYLTQIEDMGGDPKRNVEDVINKLIAKIKTAKMPSNVTNGSTKDAILANLEKFKADLVRITSDEEFKRMMEPIIKFRNANNYQYSLINTILIFVQDPEAKLVKPGGAWRDYYGRRIKPGSKPIMLWIPKGEKSRDEEEKILITNEFLTRKRVKSVKELSASDRERLNKHLNKTIPQYFDLAPYWYDWRFTEQMEGTEDVLGNPSDNIQWFDDSGEETPELVKHIDALIEVIQDKGIEVNFVDDLGGARGVSKSGVIDVLRNQPKNAGMFNTLTHEFAHELLHQKYLQSKDDETKEYFVGTEEGRGKVEQQAELCAWIVLRSFGYDMPTNINYVGIWGLNQDNAVKVFDSVSNAATYISKKINKKENGEDTDMFESKKYIKENNIPSGEEIAQMVGCGNVYRRAKKHQLMSNRNNNLNLDNNMQENILKLSENELKQFVAESIKQVLKENTEQSASFDLADEIMHCIGSDALCSRLMARLAGQISWRGVYETLKEIYETECQIELSEDVHTLYPNAASVQKSEINNLNKKVVELIKKYHPKVSLYYVDDDDDTLYEEALLKLGFKKDGYDRNDSEVFSNGKLRVVLAIDSINNVMVVRPANGYASTLGL